MDLDREAAGELSAAWAGALMTAFEDALEGGFNGGEVEVFEAFGADAAFQSIAFTCGATPLTRWSLGRWGKFELEIVDFEMIR